MLLVVNRWNVKDSSNQIGPITTEDSIRTSGQTLFHVSLLYDSYALEVIGNILLFLKWFYFRHCNTSLSSKVS